MKERKKGSFYETSCTVKQNDETNQTCKQSEMARTKNILTQSR